MERDGADFRRWQIRVYSRVIGSSVLAPDAPEVASLWFASDPVFSESIEGPSPLTLTLPVDGWELSPVTGQLDGVVGTKDLVALYVQDRWTMASADSSAWGRLVYRGTIEEIEEDGDRCTLSILPLNRLAVNGVVTTAKTYSGDTAQMARSAVTDYAPGLGWDGRNPALSGKTYASITFRSETCLELLREIAAFSGAHWQAHVTSAGMVRFFDEAANDRVHDLAEGYEVARCRLRYSSLEEVTRADVWTTDGTTAGTHTATTGEYDTLDPRVRAESFYGTITAAGAQTRADNILAEWGRLTVEGTAEVLATRYDAWSIEPGDNVYLWRRSAMSPLIRRPNIDGVPLHVAGIERRGGLHILSFVRVRPSALRTVAVEHLAGRQTARRVVVA